MPPTIIDEPAVTQGLRHAPTTIALHWLTAALVVLLWSIGQTIDFAPSGPLRVDYRSLHITLGVILAAVLIVRLLWRITRGGMLPTLQTGLWLAIARATHWALYALMLAAVGLGFTYVWARGDAIYNLFKIPQMFPGDRGFVHDIGDWHALAANTVLIVAGLHSAAALFHHFVLRDVTLRRMLPWTTR